MTATTLRIISIFTIASLVMTDASESYGATENGHTSSADIDFPRICPEQEVVDPFNLTSYMGTWYEIATTFVPRITFEKGCSCTYANYQIEDDGNVKVNNTCLTNEGAYSTIGEATTEDPTKGEFKVSFGDADIAPFVGDQPNYLILYQGIDEESDAQYTIVGSPCKLIAWILSRSTTMSETAYADAREILTEKGYKLFFLRLRETDQDATLCDPIR
eukprot:CFRG2205T1